jgi:hypothetical protein
MLEFILGYSAGSATASRAASLARSAAAADGVLHTNRLEDANERIDELAIIIRALWALMEEQGMTAEQLTAKIEEIDLADGVADGKMTQRPTQCPSCQAKVAVGLTNCQYCGASVTGSGDHPLDQI